MNILRALTFENLSPQQLLVGPVGTRVALTIVRGRGSRRQVDIIRAQNLEGAAVQKAAQYRYNALVEQQALAYPWIRRMNRKAAKSVHGGQGTVNEVSFEGAPCPIRIALKVVYQRGSSFKSAERSLWLNVDNHPHILPLLFTAGPNMLFMPFMELVYIYICMYVCIYICIYIYNICIYIYIYICTHTHTHMYTHTHTHTHTHTYVYTYTHVHIYV